MQKHWVIYRPSFGPQGQPRIGETYDVNTISQRAAELEAQRLAQARPGSSFMVFEVSKVFTTEPVVPVVPPVIEQILQDAPPEVDQEQAQAIADWFVEPAVLR